MVTGRFLSPLLERADELAHLRAAWSEAGRGHGSTWFVRAEAGGGKTRLMRELAQEAGSRALWGAAEPVAPPDPFLAIVRALPSFEPAQHRAESVARAVSLLDEHANDGPLLLVLDDLHFADDGTVAVIVRLARVRGATLARDRRISPRRGSARFATWHDRGRRTGDGAPAGPVAALA